MCSTLSFSGSGLLQRISRPFDVVVIDEAAQAVEPATLIPLCTGAKQALLASPCLSPPPSPRHCCHRGDPSICSIDVVGTSMRMPNMWSPQPLCTGARQGYPPPLVNFGSVLTEEVPLIILLLSTGVRRNEGGRLLHSPPLPLKLIWMIAPAIYYACKMESHLLMHWRPELLLRPFRATALTRSEALFKAPGGGGPASAALSGGIKLCIPVPPCRCS